MLGSGGSIGSRHAANLCALGHQVLQFDPYDAGKDVRSTLSSIMQIRSDAIAQADALVIATPTGCHYHDLLECMAAGKPTFVEKPIAATHSQWRDLQNYESTKRVFVGYNLRFHHCVIQAKKWIDEGLIGAPLWASFTCGQFNDRPAYLRDGVIFNWSHEIDLALYLLGPAKVACAAARTTDGCDNIADIVLKHESGAQSTVHLNYLTSPELRQSIVAGDKGRISIDLRDRTAAYLLTDTNCEWVRAEDSFDENYIDEMRAFIDRIEGKDVPGATGEDGLAALDICLQARKMAGLQ